MKKKIILIGAGGHCNSCIDVIESENKFKIAGLIDNKKKSLSKYKVIGSDKDLQKIKIKNILITVGQIKNPFIREKLFKLAKKLKFNFPKIKSPTSHVSEDSIIGPGTIIMHRAVINKSVKIGKNCIINTGAIIEHDVVIGDNSHISTGAIINGGVKIGQKSFIGSGSVIQQNIVIGNQCFINAKKFISQNIKDNSKIV